MDRQPAALEVFRTRTFWEGLWKGWTVRSAEPSSNSIGSSHYTTDRGLNTGTDCQEAGGDYGVTRE